MDERVVQFRVGVVVVATLLIAGILVLLFGDGALFQRERTAHIVFPRAPGIAVDTPVRKSGITIGRVSHVQLTPEGQARVTVSLAERFPVWRNDTVQISSATLLGDTFIEFVQADEPAEPIEDGDVLVGAVSPTFQDILVTLEDNIADTVVSLGRAGDEVAILARRVNTLLGDDDDRARRIAEKTELALDNFNRTMINLNRTAQQFDQVLGDEELRAAIRSSISQLPELMAETRQTMARVEGAAAAAERNLENLEGFTGPLGERGEDLLIRVESGVTQIDELMRQLVEFTDALNRPDGTLGQLVHNPELYQRLNRAAGNIEDASQRLRPILNDVRVFTDKVARDPGRVGVSGVLRRESGVK